jgi:hypothetical protein
MLNIAIFQNFFHVDGSFFSPCEMQDANELCDKMDINGDADDPHAEECRQIPQHAVTIIFLKATCCTGVHQ